MKPPVKLICLIIFYPKWSNKGDALSPLPFNFALEHAIRKVQENQDRLTLNGTHQLLIHADIVNYSDITLTP
jgi:hypothetical protein